MQRDSQLVQLHYRDSLVTWLQSGSSLHPIPHGGEAGGRDWCSQWNQLWRRLSGPTASLAELETTIQEVESCINSRPLTFVSDEPDGDEPLTPAHFLLGLGLGYIHSHSTIDPLESPSDLGHHYELRKSLLDRF